MSDTSFFMEPLDARHNRKNFDCGEPSLDEYLQRYARQSTKSGASRTHVAVLPGETRVCAYLTLSAGAVALADMPEAERRGLPRLVPSIHIGRLAVDREFQGQGLGDSLMLYAFDLTVNVAEKIGVGVLELWAINENASRFYNRYQFGSLLDDSFHLYLPARLFNSYAN